MSDAQLLNFGRYALYSVIGAVVATGLQLGAVLLGTDDVAFRPLAGTFVATYFGALSTALAASTLPRLGSEQLREEVDALREQGVSRQDMTVVRTDGAPPNADMLTPEQAARIADILQSRMQATRAKES